MLLYKSEKWAMSMHRWIEYLVMLTGTYVYIIIIMMNSINYLQLNFKWQTIKNWSSDHLQLADFGSITGYSSYLYTETKYCRRILHCLVHYRKAHVNILQHSLPGWWQIGQNRTVQYSILEFSSLKLAHTIYTLL